jgi:hypothetical protein
MSATATVPEFTYDLTTVRDMQVGDVTESKGKKKVVKSMTINGETLTPSSRFWTSLSATYGFSDAIFKYFDHSEVFERISEVEKDSDRLRICVERSVDGNNQPVNRLLGVSKPTRPIITHEELQNKLGMHGGRDNQQYHDGLVESFHTPRAGANNFQVAGDNFVNRFVMVTPIDGYGMPNVYLSLMRQVCSNGAIAYARAFKSQLALGKGDEDTTYSFVRALDQFSNDEGYAALRQRFESAAESWASVSEAQSLYKLLVKSLNTAGAIQQSHDAMKATPFMRKALEKSYSRSSAIEDETAAAGTPVLRAFHATTGDITELYGLANIDAMSQKRQKTLPTKATIYDLINFATEVATHHADVFTGRQLNAWMGTLVSGEYDMEGTCTEFKDFADFHLTSKIRAGVTGSN